MYWTIYYKMFGFTNTTMCHSETQTQYFIRSMKEQFKNEFQVITILEQSKSKVNRG